MVKTGCLTQVYISLPNSEHRRDVVRKYIHPDWEPTTMVANLALLKLNSRFPNHLSAPIHSLIDNDLERLPNTFDFKGFGKINLKLYAEQFIDDIEAKRTVNASYNDSCPSYVDNKSVILSIMSVTTITINGHIEALPCFLYRLFAIFFIFSPSTIMSFLEFRSPNFLT